MSGKKRTVSKEATTDKPVVVPQAQVQEKEAVADNVVTYPRSVLLKNNTPRRVKESVTGVALMPYSENAVEVKSEGDLKQIINNFMQLNTLNKWVNGLQVIHPLGDDNA